MADRIRLTNSQSLNSQGFRVLSSGAMLDRFLKNPVMFFNHQKWDAPIGKWLAIEQDENEITAEPSFWTKSQEAAQYAEMYDDGILNAASISLRIIETSEDPELLLPGQKYPTVTKWELMEASIVSIPADADAVRLYDQSGNEIDLKDEQAVKLAFSQKTENLMSTEQKTPKPSVWDRAKAFYKSLGLSEESLEKALDEAENEPEPTEKELSLSARITELEKELSDKGTELDGKAKRITELEQEVAKLSSAPGDNPPPKPKNDGKGGEGHAMLSETQQAIELFDKLNKKKRGQA